MAQGRGRRSRKRLFSSCHDRVAARARSESKVGEQVDSSQSNRAFRLVGNQRHESSVKVTKNCVQGERECEHERECKLRHTNIG